MENHEDPRPQKRIRSGKDVVRFYKGLGFFAGESVESVVRRYRKDMECAPDAGIGFDAELLSFDEKKTWHNSESDQDVHRLTISTVGSCRSSRESPEGHLSLGRLVNIGRARPVPSGSSSNWAGTR